MQRNSLNDPATVDLQRAGSVAEMANREGWDDDTYVVSLSETIRRTTIPLDRQLERLQALASVGAAADRAAADALVQQLALLEALHQRFAYEGCLLLRSEKNRASEIAERYLNASLKAQAAAVRVLSALKALRDSPSVEPPTTLQALPVASALPQAE